MSLCPCLPGREGRISNAEVEHEAVERNRQGEHRGGNRGCLADTNLIAERLGPTAHSNHRARAYIRPLFSST